MSIISEIDIAVSLFLGLIIFTIPSISIIDGCDRRLWVKCLLNIIAPSIYLLYFIIRSSFKNFRNASISYIMLATGVYYNFLLISIPLSLFLLRMLFAENLHLSELYPLKFQIVADYISFLDISIFFYIYLFIYAIFIVVLYLRIFNIKIFNIIHHFISLVVLLFVCINSALGILLLCS